MSFFQGDRCPEGKDTDAGEEVMCWLSKLFKPELEKPKPILKQIRAVSWGKVVSELNELGVELMLKDKFQPDSYVYHVDEEDWQKLVPYLTFSGEYYMLTPEAPDCDDYAKKASAEAAFQFHLSCLECWGETPYRSETNPTGRHAFGLVRIAEKNYRIFEPNAAFEEAGELFEFGEHGYMPDSWRL